MESGEFKTQIVKTLEQWSSGLLDRLSWAETSDIHHISLGPTPVFDRWVLRGGREVQNPTALVVDECGQIYFIDTTTQGERNRTICPIYLYEPQSGNFEQISGIEDGFNPKPDRGCPNRMLLGRFTMWINDRRNGRVLAFSRAHFQIICIISSYLKDGEEEPLDPVDIASDESGNCYLLHEDPGRGLIIKCDAEGRPISIYPILGLHPVAITIDEENRLFVASDTALRRYTQKDGDISKDFTIDLSVLINGAQPVTMVFGRKSNIFLSDSSGGVHAFSTDGGYLGRISPEGWTEPARSLAVDSQGNLYVATSKGIALFMTKQRFAKEGVYYSKTLDSGIEECQWHRLSLEMSLPSNTAIEVQHHCFDDSALKGIIEAILSDTASSVADKAKRIDEMINGRWSAPPEKFIPSPESSGEKATASAENTVPAKPPPKWEDMLFRSSRGRYLLLKAKLSTFDQMASPCIFQMKVFYPRISYLRYLPAIYQEDPVSREFLERFLSLFESVFYDLEIKISNVFEYFDPDTTPSDFLSWLASWLNLALEEGWPVEIKRQFIREAAGLYKMKGTAAGIAKVLKIYTGQEPVIIENQIQDKVMVLGNDSKLGINSFVLQGPVRGFRLGDGSILGKTALREVDMLPEDPLLALAYKFTIILSLMPHECDALKRRLGLRQHEYDALKSVLKRLVGEWKPAHTDFRLHLLRETRLGIGTYVGISRIMDCRPFKLGVDGTIGSAIVVMAGQDAGKIEQHALIQKDTELI